ncbi:MAG TPA: hypothetical protein VMY37_27895, partial [Thermoguttaceae bacterium]|nr:hypothetical protein [Thermoguttaceae bacterium]
MGTELATFDYGDLAAPDATALEKHAKRIDDIQVKTRRIAAEAVIAVGKELKAAHERLAGKGREGLFRPWVQRCGFSHTSAYKAVAAYDTFGGEKCKSSLHLFDCNALYLLSAPSCPEDATAEAIQRAEKGERITHKVAKSLKEECGPAKEEEDDTTAG